MIVSLTGQKGGSGKTTTALCLADEWHRRGRSVLVVDTDPQATARTWADVAAERGEDGPTVIGMGVGFHERISTLAQSYDIVVIDCPPGKDSEIPRGALMVSDLALIPCGPGTTDVWSLAETIDLVRQARVIRPALEVALFVTRRDARTAIGEQITQSLQSTGLPVLDASLGFRVAYQECPSSGLGVTRYAPKDAAAKEVIALVDEIEARYGQEG